MRKVLALLTVVGLLGFGVMGCSKGDDKKTDKPTEEKKDDAEEKKDDAEAGEEKKDDAEAGEEKKDDAEGGEEKKTDGEGS